MPNCVRLQRNDLQVSLCGLSYLAAFIALIVREMCSDRFKLCFISTELNLSV